MLGSALKKFSKCSITFERRGRTLNSFGGFVTDKIEDCEHKAFINYKETEKLKVNSDDAYGFDMLVIYLIGDHSYLNLNDTGLLDSETYEVRERRYRPFGNFTKVVISKITRRALTA